MYSIANCGTATKRRINMAQNKSQQSSYSEEPWSDVIQAQCTNRVCVIITLPDSSWYKLHLLPVHLLCDTVRSSLANMAFLNTLRQWDEAVTSADKQDFSGALKIFQAIEEPNSKICFDIGCLCLLHQDLDAAEKVWLTIAGEWKHHKHSVVWWSRKITWFIDEEEIKH